MNKKLSNIEKQKFDQFLSDTHVQQIRQLPTCIDASDNYLATTYIEDVWLRKYCTLDFIISGLIECYETEYPTVELLSEKCTFDPNCVYIYEVRAGQTNIYFYKDHPDPDYIELLTENDTVLIYGTTFFYKFMDNVMFKLNDGRGPNMEIMLDYFGCDIKITNDTYFIDDTEIAFFSIPLSYIKLPKFKLSFDVSDIADCDPEFIHFSDENSVHVLTDYIGWHQLVSEDKLPSAIRQGRFGIPNYIVKSIKNDDTGREDC